MPHLLPSVSSVPGRSLCPEGGWPLEGAWQSWPYLPRQRQTDRSYIWLVEQSLKELFFLGQLGLIFVTSAIVSTGYNTIIVTL